MAGNGWHQIHKLLFTRPLIKKMGSLRLKEAA
jgi:hypothetical protein